MKVVALPLLVHQRMICINSAKLGNWEISIEYNSKEYLRLAVSGKQSHKSLRTKTFFIRTMELSKFSILAAQDETSYHFGEVDTPISLCTPVCGSDVAAA
ncbi:hypothetical protein WA026_009284 [Henosepilachna vigintioctopunctata]|uniref:Uncharacterized protein n=1 Tax=Henosepilachna vigintioctopunctata TaxID=420089 RepID=A0AAW1UYX7_9CUCU